jgi:hypothetical protein
MIYVRDLNQKLPTYSLGDILDTEEKFSIPLYEQAKFVITNRHAPSLNFLGSVLPGY